MWARGLRGLSGLRGLRGLCSAPPAPEVQCPYADVPEVQQTVPEFLWSRLEHWQDKVCIECAETGRRFTYAEVRDRSRRLAAALQRRLGLRPGHTVALLLPNVPEFPIALLGAMEAGLVVTTLNPAYTAGEVRRQLQDSGASCALAAAALVPVLRAAAAQLPVLTAAELLQLSDPGSGPGGGLQLPHPPPCDPAGLALLPYSSGTTGLPKGVMLSHRCLATNVCQLHAPAIALARPAIGDHQDVVPALVPFFHLYGLAIVTLAQMALGSKIVSLPTFSPEGFLGLLERYQASVLYVAPPLLLLLASHPAVRPERHLGGLRAVVSAAAPLGEADVLRLLERAPAHTGLSVVQAYGLTETGPVLTHNRPGSDKLQSVGPPVAGTRAQVRDLQTGAPLGPWQRGELCFAGPQLMMGYLNNPEATAATIGADGFISTGDIGYYDEDGDFFVDDRVKELIKVKGFQVAPAELEALLRSHPAVADAAVVPVADARAGELPRAFVVVRAGAAAPSAEQLQQFVAENAAPYKRLAGGVRFVDAIPKNPSGKILRRRLRDLP